MESVGKLESFNPTVMTAVGTARYGFQKVRVSISILPQGDNMARIVFNAASDDIWGAAARSAIDRIITTIGLVGDDGLLLQKDFNQDRIGVPIWRLGLMMLVFMIFVSVLTFKVIS